MMSRTRVTAAIVRRVTVTNDTDKYIFFIFFTNKTENSKFSISRQGGCLNYRNTVAQYVVVPSFRVNAPALKSPRQTMIILLVRGFATRTALDAGRVIFTTAVRAVGLSPPNCSM